MDSNVSAGLRQQAEELIDQTPSQFSATSLEDVQRLLHELQIYQTELELQNDELRRTQLELIASRDRFSDLYDFAPVGYLTVSSKGQVIAANLVAAELLQVTRKKLVGSFFSRYISDDNSGLLYHHYKSAAASDRSEVGEFRLADDDSRPVKDIRVTSVRDRTNSDDSHELRLAITEITQQKISDEKLKALQEKVRKTARLNDLGVIAGGVAHDFNNLLTPMLGYAQLSARLIDADSPVHKYVGGIERAAKEATEICRNMLDYAGGGPVVRSSPVNVASVVDELVSVLRPIVGTKTQLVINTDSASPSATADRSQIVRIVMNLVTNAAEAIADRDGGRISITVASTYLDSENIEEMVLGNEVLAGDYVRLEVIDNGCGMDSDTLNQIFDPFFTTKFAGRGLGMAAVVGIAHGQNVAIDVHSLVGKGSRLGVYFPVCQKPDVTRTIEQDAELVPGTGTILIVDDDALVRNSTSIILGLAGYSVQEAESGQQAIDIFSKLDHGIDLVLMDLMMPKMDGVATLEVLKKIQPDVKIVLTSGFAREAATKRLRNHSVAGFVVKPSSIGVLTGEISQALIGPQ